MVSPNSLKNHRSSANKIILGIVCCYVNIYNNLYSEACLERNLGITEIRFLAENFYNQEYLEVPRIQIHVDM
jgi:hypothetical protein